MKLEYLSCIPITLAQCFQVSTYVNTLLLSPLPVSLYCCKQLLQLNLRDKRAKTTWKMSTN
jgi:hypothetical protein